MTTFHYPARVTTGRSGRVLVEFPAFPNAATDGKDVEEALEEASDCLGCAIAFALQDNKDVPRPARPAKREVMVPVPLQLAPKLALYFSMRDQGISKSELARRMGVRETVVRRMLDPMRATKPAKLDAALAALGVKLVVRMEKKRKAEAAT